MHRKAKMTKGGRVVRREKTGYYVDRRGDVREFPMHGGRRGRRRRKGSPRKRRQTPRQRAASLRNLRLARAAIRRRGRRRGRR
jgi:hypothetical protein